MRNKMWLARLVPRLLIIGVLLASVVMPILPPQNEAKAAPTYPVLPAGLNYYQTIFPAGLVYSDGWYGTFTSAPKAQAILLFDDDYLPAWGRAIFAMSPAPQKQPSGAQGGTSLTAITRDQANTIIQSYALSNFAAVDPEILQVMPRELHFAGVWAGDKLAQKWSADIPPPSNLTQKQRDYLATTSSVINIKRAQTEKAIRDFDPDRFWVPNSAVGNWNDTVMWSAASGGASGASVPSNVDNTFFDALSFTSANKTVTINVAANTLSMNWTGATNTPTLAGSQVLTIYGNTTFILAMAFNTSGGIVFTPATTKTLTTNGVTLANINYIYFGGSAQVSIQDNLILGGPIDLYITSTGGLITNGYTVTGRTFNLGSTSTITPGASIINAGSWQASAGLTVIANTATINISGTGAFAGGSVNYNGATFNLNGTAYTVTGNNTMAALNFKPAGAQTITATGTTQNVTSMSRTGTGQISLNGSYVDSSGTNSLDYMTITNSAASGGAIFNAVGGSVNGGGNTGWNFPLTIATGAASGVAMDKDGVTAATVAGTITDMGGSATVGAWFDYGLTVGYGSTTTNVTYSTTNFTGTKTQTLPTNLTPGQTYHFRRAITSGANTTYGSDAQFTFTTPTHTTGIAQNIAMDKDGVTSGSFVGNVSSMGVATSAYGKFDYGLTGAYGSTTANQTISGTGNYTAVIPAGLTPGETYHFRAKIANGAVTNNAADADFTLTMPTAVTGAVTVTGGSQATLNANVSNLGVATSYYRFFEYWGADGVHLTTTETTGTATSAYSDTVEGISTIGGFSYRAGVRVGTVYTYGATATLQSSYTGADTILRITPLLIWVALLIAIVYLFISGYHKMKAGDNAGGNTFWLLAVIAIVINTVTFPLVWEAIKALLGE